MSVGRLGPLAATLGVGTAIAFCCGGVATAAPSTADSSSAAGLSHAPGSHAKGHGVRASSGSRAAKSGAGTPANGTATTRPRRQPAANLGLAPPASAEAVSSPRASSGGFGALFNNQTPTLNPAQSGPSVGGVVSGQLNAADPDSSPLSYTVTEAPAHGSVTLDSGGGYTYTLDRELAPTGAIDSFQVMVSDAGSGFHFHGLAGLLNLLSFGLIGSSGHTRTSTVSVSVASFDPGNAAPTGSANVNPPNSSTGVVTGEVVGSDIDGDPLTYSGPASTAKGGIVLAPSGAFTYTPTGTARHQASATNAAPSATTDTFTVTIADGRGGTVAVPVTVAVSPRNTAPTGTASAGAPDATTGVVTGAVVGSDTESDALTYSGSTATAKGAVTVTTTGAFTYTPSATARTNAAAPGATDADKADSFTVTVNDGHGGTAYVPVSVVVGGAAGGLDGPLPAFPGAEGFGAFATGGRGGSVIYVTNLNADGPGSLQWAIDQPGAKYVLFKVSGVINTQIHLTNGDITIAGQTSPGGITLRGLVTDESPYQDQDVHPPGDFAENWILQDIRIRPGADGPSDDGLRLRYTRNGIVDHVSIGNATDEAIEISYSNNITVQNTIIAETVGGHAFYGGILMNYSNPANGFELNNVSLHHNIFDRIEGRLPEGSRESRAAAGSTMNLEMSNNLYWDPRFYVALGVGTNVVTNSHGDPYPIYWKINAVNNFFQVSPGFQYGMFDENILHVPQNQLYITGNKMNIYPTRSDYQLFYCCNDYASLSNPNATSREAQAMPSRLPFPAITYTPTDQLRTVLLNTAGSWPRDPMDTRLLSNVAQNTISGSPPNVNPAGDALLPAYTGSAPAAPTDTDADGMPDTWEVAKGLNPNVANTNGTHLSTVGYTDLDVYLQELMTSRINP